MQNILVTGAAGFIGSNFVRYWNAQHPSDKVVALDACNYAANLENLAETQSTFIQADICDYDTIKQILDEHKIDVVVNFAAESHNSYAILNPSIFMKTNALGTQQLCEAIRTSNVKRFHHISTCEVYGELELDSKDEFFEGSAYNPQTPYNASKAAADHIVRAYGSTFDLPYTISNCANNYGKYQFPEKVIPLFAINLLLDRKLPVYEASENRREWIHVLDHCAAIDKILQSPKLQETYNVGTGLELSVMDLAKIILNYFDKDESYIEIVKNRPSHDKRYLLNSDKIKKELAFEPKIDFEDGIKETLAWYKDNPEWWKPLLDKSPVDETTWNQS